MIGESAEARIIDPGVLHELELAGEVRGEGDEVQAPVLVSPSRVDACREQIGPRQQRAVLAPPPQQAVALVDLDGALAAGLRVARVGPADVRADRTAQAVAV